MKRAPNGPGTRPTVGSGAGAQALAEPVEC